MPASPSTARAMNDRLALQYLQEEGPLTAGQLKTLTGLSRPTVADLVERLQTSGLIAVVGEAGARRRGPNARLYGIVADRAHLAALDVRTDSVRVGVADLLGSILAEASLPVGGATGPGPGAWPSGAGGAEPAVERAVALLERTVGEAGATRLRHIVIGAPGLVDPATGELRATSGTSAWHGRLVDALREGQAGVAGGGAGAGATVTVENETNLAAVAEQRAGAARDRDTFVFLWLGYGTGAAVVLDGRLRRGVSGGAGEIGFLPVPGTSGLPSATGCDGGFDSLVGGAALVGLAEEHGVVARDAAPPENEEGGATEDGGGAAAPPAAALVRAALSAGAAGDAFLDVLADRVALGAASVAAVLDPGCVVLGGEVGHAGGKALATRVEERLLRLSPLRTEVRAGTLGGAAVLRGALLVARDAAQDELFGPRE
ncbi:ROK family transcriptional regulator [Streptomyces sp. NPDC054796]